MNRTPLRNLASDRAGVHLAITSLSLVLTGFLLVWATDQRRGVSDRWVRRFERAMLIEDSLENALEEATHELMAGVNDPSHPLYAELRQAGTARVKYQPNLSWTRAQADTPDDLAVEIEIGRQKLPGSEDGEWVGNAKIVVKSEGRIATRKHGIRSLILGFPSPFRSDCAHDWENPRPGRPGIPLRMPRQSLANLASLRLPLDRPVQEAFAELSEELEGIVGVVDTGPRQEPFRLVEYTHRGRTVLLVRGPLVLEDVRLEDPDRDELVIYALGDVNLRGQVQAKILLTGIDGEPDPQREFGGGARIQGGLLLASGSYRSSSSIEVECAPPNPLTQDSLARLHVFVSPDAQEGREAS